ncbi:DUF1266 domain-containing protein [Nonomuraea turcica]|uniref:DUF1266 domain-containing protein n=1 Tax=Nonomuraea sp. G32 TaxID=3067274 RepID=UPI0035304DD1
MSAHFAEPYEAEQAAIKAGELARQVYRTWEAYSAGYILGRVLRFDGEAFGYMYASSGFPNAALPMTGSDLRIHVTNMYVTLLGPGILVRSGGCAVAGLLQPQSFEPGSCPIHDERAPGIQSSRRSSSACPACSTYRRKALINCGSAPNCSALKELSLSDRSRPAAGLCSCSSSLTVTFPYLPRSRTVLSEFQPGIFRGITVCNQLTTGM